MIVAALHNFLGRGSSGRDRPIVRDIIIGSSRAAHFSKPWESVMSAIRP
jgi:hypothetical protein